MALGERLRQGRQAAGLSLEEAAEKMRTNPPRLEKWERGEGEPTIDELRAAVRLYRVPAEFLLETEEAAFTPRQWEILRGLAAEFRRINREKVRRRCQPDYAGFPLLLIVRCRVMSSGRKRPALSGNSEREGGVALPHKQRIGPPSRETRAGTVVFQSFWFAQLVKDGGAARNRPGAEGSGNLPRLPPASE